MSVTTTTTTTDDRRRCVYSYGSVKRHPVMLSKVSSQSVKCVVSRGRPLSLFIIRYRGGGKEGLAEACTSFNVIPLDVWGTILSVYCLCSGVAFRDVELNTRIKTVLSSLRMLFGRRCIIQL